MHNAISIAVVDDLPEDRKRLKTALMDYAAGHGTTCASTRV